MDLPHLSQPRSPILSALRYSHNNHKVVNWCTITQIHTPITVKPTPSFLTLISEWALRFRREHPHRQANHCFFPTNHSKLSRPKTRRPPLIYPLLCFPTSLLQLPPRLPRTARSPCPTKNAEDPGFLSTPLPCWKGKQPSHASQAILRPNTKEREKSALGTWDFVPPRPLWTNSRQK